MERNSIFKSYKNRVEKGSNLLNTFIFKQSKKEEIIELSNDFTEKGEFIGKPVDNVNIDTQKASINEEIDPTEDEIVNKLLEEKRNESFNEEPIEDPSLSNLGLPITDKKKMIQEEMALLEN